MRLEVNDALELDERTAAALARGELPPDPDEPEPSGPLWLLAALGVGVARLLLGGGLLLWRAGRWLAGVLWGLLWRLRGALLLAGVGAALWSLPIKGLEPWRHRVREEALRIEEVAARRGWVGAPGLGCQARPASGREEARWWQAAREAVNVRAGPGTSYRVIGGVDRGAVVTLGREERRGWSQVALRGGLQGWVKTDLGHLWAEAGCGVWSPVWGSVIDDGGGRPHPLPRAETEWVLGAEADPASGRVYLAPGVRAQLRFD